MRRSSKGNSTRLSADSQRFITYCEGIMQAGSRLEERGWERNLDSLLQKTLKHNHQDVIDAALDHLFKAKTEAYEVFLQSVEAASESATIEHEGVHYDALLVAVPILAWTRFAIASGPISQDMLMTMTAHLYAHILAQDTRVCMAPTLFSIDQLPRSHAETHILTQRMAQAALTGTALRNPGALQETVPFLADTRYLLATVVAPAGAPLFRWQASGNPADRETALAQWQAQARPNIERLLPGCGVELVLPDAYFMACRQADKQIRPTAVTAAVHYLTHTLDITPAQLSVVIGGFGDVTAGERIDEYRISYMLQPGMEVVYGFVWPLYGEEEAGVQESAPLSIGGAAGSSAAVPVPIAPLQEIIALLKQSGITDIKLHDEFFPLEFCDDCDAPLYCDQEGELVHAEMPEQAIQAPAHLH